MLAIEKLLFIDRAGKALAVRKLRGLLPPVWIDPWQ
jgi:hypothetical protein